MTSPPKTLRLIPDAKPPVGDLRWKAPVKNDPWTTVRHETAFSSACTQSASSQGPLSTDDAVRRGLREPLDAMPLTGAHGRT